MAGFFCLARGGSLDANYAVSVKACAARRANAELRRDFGIQIGESGITAHHGTNPSKRMLRGVAELNEAGKRSDGDCTPLGRRVARYLNQCVLTDAGFEAIRGDSELGLAGAIYIGPFQSLQGPRQSVKPHLYRRRDSLYGNVLRFTFRHLALEQGNRNVSGSRSLQGSFNTSLRLRVPLSGRVLRLQ